MASIWGELRRRNVVRVAMAYAVVGWVLVEVASTVFPTFNAPTWIMQVFTFVVIAGFPLAVVFAWAFELTPEGLKREKEVDRSESITRQTGRKLDFLIIGVLVIAVSLLLGDKFLLTEEPVPTEVVADEASVVPDVAPSIAVLPFLNMSADADSAYFSDGLADTVLHMLAQIRELRVAARTSSFQFRDTSMDIAKIGEQLNVSTILEGSVQRSGDKIRITAQLIDVSNGFHLWSGNFDRNLDDVFAIQDEIASEVVAALKLSLLGESDDYLRRDQTDNVDAYTEYLLAINDLNQTSSENLLSAVGHLQEAIRLDPNYARAHSTLGRAFLNLRDWGAMSRTEANAAARNSASRALEISADSSEALAVLGNVELSDGNLPSAEQLLNKATEINPNDIVALQYYARYLGADAQPIKATETFRKMLRLDPLSESAYVGLARSLIFRRKFSEVTDLLARLRSIAPGSQSADSMEYWNATAQSKWADAIVVMTDSIERFPDDIDPEGPALLGHAYLAIDMPEEASRWFDRAVEIDAQHPMTRSAPLYLNYYLQQNEDDNGRLARKLLDDGIDPRLGSRGIARIVAIEYAAKTGRHEFALDALDNLYPNLFDDPPHGLETIPEATFDAGWALIQSGDVERGSHLMQAYLDWLERYEEVYGTDRRSISGRLLLGDTGGALDKLATFVPLEGFSYLSRLRMERSSVYDPIREEPAFVAMLDEYRENAAEQRRLLQAMNRDTSVQ